MNLNSTPLVNVLHENVVNEILKVILGYREMPVVGNLTKWHAIAFPVLPGSRRFKFQNSG